MIAFELNGERVDVDVPGDMPLLWVIRDALRLTGTKYSCGIAQCGACTVHLDGAAVRSCSVPVAAVSGRRVRTIESMGDAGAPSAVQQAWLDEQVPQCGYCQSGMIMAVESLLDRIPRPTDADIDREITNICRCGTYPRIRRAIHKAAGLRRSSSA